MNCLIKITQKSKTVDIELSNHSFICKDSKPDTEARCIKCSVITNNRLLTTMMNNPKSKNNTYHYNP